MKVFIYICLLTVFIGIVVIFTNNRNSDEYVIPVTRIMHDSVFDFNKDVWKTYIYASDMSSFNEHNGLQTNKVDYINYATRASTAVTELYEYNSGNRKDVDKFNKALYILNNLKNTFYRYGFFPRPAYENFQYGWVSSMDAPVVALAAQMAYEITDDEQWSSFRNDLLSYCKKNTKEHGFLLKEKDGNIWPLEYAEQSTTEENAEYVINGSLFGYQALEMLASVYEDKELYGILDKILYNYEKKSPDYIYNNEEWLWYSLNPKIINPGAKIIIELHALEGLSAVLPDYKFFTDEIFVRQRIFSKLYKTFKVGNTGYFWRAAGPHPYIIDIMPTLLELCDDRGSVLYRHYMNGREFKDSWMVFDLPNDVKHVNVYAAPFKSDSGEFLYMTLLCENDVETINYKESSYDILPYAMSVEDNSLSINLKKEIDFSKTFVRWGVELENNTDKIYNIRLLFDNDMNRYYTPLKPGKNLILINTLGIRNSDDSRVKTIKNIKFKFFSQDGDVDVKNIRIKNVVLFNNAYEIYEYQKNSEYIVNFQ